MLILSVLALAWASPAWAATFECEHYLRDRLRFAAERDLKAAVTEAPFTFFTAHAITYKARHRLRLGQEIEQRPELARVLIATLHRTVDAPWTLRLRRLNVATTKDASWREFPDVNPLLWQMVRVPAHAVAQVPLAAAPPLKTEAPLREHQIGFVTDPDREGVRIYLRAHEDVAEQMVYLELGLDVPPADLPKYLEADEIRRGFSHLVRTPATRYARVPALVFARPKAK